MRFTQPLLRLRMNWLSDASWQKFRKKVLYNDGIEAKLKESGIEVIDANEFVKTKKHWSPTYIDITKVPSAPKLFPEPPKKNSLHPDWHDTTRKIFDDQCFPIEGVAQAQVLTKSVQIKKGLPVSILELGHFTRIKDQDALVQRIIKQAFIHDSTNVGLPKLKNFDYPAYSFRKEFGIPKKRSMDIMVRNFLRLCESHLSGLAVKRAFIEEETYRANFEREGQIVQIKLKPSLTLIGKDLLGAAISEEMSEEAEKIPIPELFPFSPLANFEVENVYKEDDHLVFRENCPFPFIHTTFHSHSIPGSHTHIHPRWNDDRFGGSTIIYAFAPAMLNARRKYGNDVKTLPEPVTTQVVHLIDNVFQFAVFQLNTLDLEGHCQKKNILWITDKIPIFKVCRDEYGIERFEGYNPEVFKHFIAFYANENQETS